MKELRLCTATMDGVRGMGLTLKRKILSWCFFALRMVLVVGLFPRVVMVVKGSDSSSPIMIFCG